VRGRRKGRNRVRRLEGGSEKREREEKGEKDRSEAVKVRRGTRRSGNIELRV
jgi:hypothetical protein